MSSGYVVLGSKTVETTEPIVLGDKLVSFLKNLLSALANGTVITPAGASSPLVTLIPALQTSLLAELEFLLSKTSRVK